MKIDNYKLLGVNITTGSFDDILEIFFSGVKNSNEKFYVVTPNPEIIVRANKDRGFKDILNNARVSLCDGVGVVWASRFLDKKRISRITGVDFLEMICEKSDKNIRIGFLGGKKGVAEKTAACLKTKYSNLHVVMTATEWDESYNDKSIDILFVAFGFPKQELWMSQHINKTRVKAMMGVGGAFDYISGNVIRAPNFIRRMGFEWLFRLIRQPWRLKRQLALLVFIYLVVKEKMQRH